MDNSTPSGGVTMANSGIPWIDATFDWCVYLLVDAASFLGISYEEINIWLFVIILPTALILSFGVNVFFIVGKYREQNKLENREI